MTFRNRPLVLALSSVFLLATGCAGAAAGDGETTIVVGTPNKTGLHRTLVSSGLDQGTDYGIEFADFDSTPPLIEALNAGQVDIAAGGETGVLFAIANGADIAIIGATHPDEAAVSAVLVKNDSPIEDLSELAGKRIALPYYTKQHYQLARAFEHAGLQWEDADIVNLDTTAGLAALNNGEVDAFVVWDPNVAAAEVENDARVLFNLYDVSSDPGALYVRSSALEEEGKKEALEDVTTRIIQSEQWVRDNLDEWTEEVAELSGLSPEVAELYTSRSTGSSYVPVDDEVIEAWQEQVDYFAEIGQIDQSFDVREHVDDSFADAITGAL